MAGSRSLGTLSVDLLLRTGNFVRGMGAAERQADKSARAIAKRHRELAKNLDEIYRGIGLAAAAAFAAIGVSVKRSVDDMWQMVTVAKQIGMGAEDFSALVAVAKDAEIGMDSLSTGIRTMARNLALAQQGSAQAANAFKALGLDPAKLKDSKTAVLAIADALSHYRDDVNKTAIEQQIFGRSGAELNELLNQGSVALTALMDKQREMGNVVTPAAAKALADYDEAADRLNDQITGLRNTLAVALLPAMTEATEKLNGFIGSLDHQTVDDFAGTITGLGDAFGYVVKQTADGFKAVQAFGRWMAFRKSGVIDTDAPLKDQESQFNALLSKQQTLQNRFNATGNAFVKSQLDEVNKQVRQAQDAFKAMELLRHPGGAASGLPENKVLTGKDVPAWMKAGLGAKSPTDLPSLKLLPTSGGKTAKDADKDARAYQRTLADLQTQMHELDGIYSQNIASINGITDAEQAFNERMDGANQLLEAGRINWEQYSNIANDALGQLNGKAVETFSSLQQLNNDLMQGMSFAFHGFVSDFSDGIANMMEGGKLGFKSILRDFLKMVERMIIQWLILKAIMGIGGAMGGTESGTNLASFLFRGGSMPARAGGGPVSAGTTYLVGEKGPELFTPSASGTITANNRIATGGGITVNSAVTVNADNASDDPAAAKQLAKMIEAQTKTVVLRATQPGGILWKQRNGVAA